MLDVSKTNDKSHADGKILQRVADGSYGLCVDCGDAIATARLHANPVALRCVACQDKAEQASGATKPAGY